MLFKSVILIGLLFLYYGGGRVYSRENEAISKLLEDGITQIHEDGIEEEEHMHIAILKESRLLIHRTKAVLKQSYKEGHFVFR